MMKAFSCYRSAGSHLAVRFEQRDALNVRIHRPLFKQGGLLSPVGGGKGIICGTGYPRQSPHQQQHHG